MGMYMGETIIKDNESWGKMLIQMRNCLRLENKRKINRRKK
jgi:hypothetical protein